MKKTNTVGGKKIRSGRALYTMYLCICCYLSFPNKQTVVRDLCTGLHLNAPTVDHHHHAPQTHRNDESPGRKRTRRVGVQGTPAIFYYNIPFLTPGLCCEQIQMQQHTNRRDQRGETPSRHVLFTHRHDERGNPFSPCFLHTQTRRGGGNPLPSCFHHTQTRREGGNPLPLCFHRRQMRQEGKPLLSVFSSHTDTTRGGKPSPVVFSSHTDATRGEKPLLAVFPSTQTRREVFSPSFHFCNID
jgi:hypothetical protein